MQPQPGSVSAAQLHYPSGLPVIARKEEILTAIADHQVVVIAGETGSGKTTQLPKMCLELGRGRDGQIGHTQPRRIAARSVAERIAHEMETDLGEVVGYKVRFADRSSDRTRLKVMTDGTLLAELGRDRNLSRYDTIIIDEAHERSLNIDFILGYLKQLLARRPELKVIITSATIDPQRFAEHFAIDARGNPVREVPIIEVSGRTYPVQIRYRPLLERDQISAVREAVEELWTETPPGHLATDILVFFSGEREIREAAEALKALQLPSTEVLPLYARLSAAEQHRIFTPSKRRRIILATNVAETSLTVPGIGYVIDTGTARISRYSSRTKVQRLPIEPISRASAAQRSGRCGRVADGVAIRLYSQVDFEGRPEFTEPEILRTSLASVILRMTALGLGEVARFPFVDPPDQRQIADGMRLLEELGAIKIGGDRKRARLTAYGKTLSRLPIDPRLGRMLIEADRLGCTREVMILVAALSVQDPRERPAEAEAQAQQQHRRFTHEKSDFASYLNLWSYLQKQRKALSSSAFRRACKREYLHYLRVREWQDVHAQLRTACTQARLNPDQATSATLAEADWDTIHRALLSGLLSHIGARDERKREYAGARGARFAINPGSGLFRRQPDLVMAAELVETSRLWARVCAAIEPEWAEQAGKDLVKRSYSHPRWSRSAGSVLASERVTLYGVPLVADRQVQYARIDAAEARYLFIRRALVEGDWDTQHDFWRTNNELLQRVSELEERSRRRDLVVDDDTLHEFYDARIPPEVVSSGHFDRWWKQARRITPMLLELTEEALLREASGAVSAQDYPAVWTQRELALALTYQFDPTSPEDGVTVHLPVATLNQVTSDGFDWQVPGFREELVTALLKSLPKPIRRHCVPAAEVAAAVSERLAGATEADREQPLTAVLSSILQERTGVSIGPDDWDWSRVPDHLKITFSVERADGTVLTTSKSLAAAVDGTRGEVRTQMAVAGASIERAGLTSWDFGELPVTVEAAADGHLLQGYPALVDERTSVSLKVFADQDLADVAHHGGVRRLLLLTVTPPWKRVLAGLSTAQKLTLSAAPHGSTTALLADVLEAATDWIVAESSAGQVRTKAQFGQVVSAVRTHLAARVLALIELVEPVIGAATRLRERLDHVDSSAPTGQLEMAAADLRAQLDSLVGSGFVSATGADTLAQLPRYLRAIEMRLDKAASNPREPALQREIDRVEAAYLALLDSIPPLRRQAPQVRELAWMIEELRVSLFAQSLGTARPVSTKRVLAAIADAGMAGH